MAAQRLSDYQEELGRGDIPQQFRNGKKWEYIILYATVGGASRELTEVAGRIRQAETECEQGQKGGRDEQLRQSRSDEGRVEGRNMFI